ncbi:MAG: hypothetical protein MUD01_13965 [Chloroflexaceae bacterium]|jgi:hypothetical protein|nr:hypothetical protein [Chloroflexaceae bacterium]
MPIVNRQSLIVNATLLLFIMLLSACGLRKAAAPPAPTATPGLISVEVAVVQALRQLREGGIYTRMEGEPVEMRGELTSGPEPLWLLYIRGQVIETIPAAAGSDIPERQLVAERQVVVRVNARTAEVTNVTAYAAGEEMNVQHLPLLALPSGPTPIIPTPPTYQTTVPAPTAPPAPTKVNTQEFLAYSTVLRHMFSPQYLLPAGTTLSLIGVNPLLNARELPRDETGNGPPLPFNPQPLLAPYANQVELIERTQLRDRISDTTATVERLWIALGPLEPQPDGSVRVMVEFFRNPFNAGAYELELHRTKGGWQVDSARLLWVS